MVEKNAGGQGDTDTAKGDQKVDDKSKGGAADEKGGAADKGAGDKAGDKVDDKAGDKSGDKAGEKGDDTQKDKGSKADDSGQSKAPDKYELAIPDGAADYLDDADLKTIEKQARAAGWTNAEAQERIDQYADGLAAQSADFRKLTEADPIYGGDHLQETQRLARLALDRVRPADTPQGQELRRILAKTGYGNHLAVVSLLADLGKLMAEDQPGAQGSASRSKGSAANDPAAQAEKLYGKT